VGDLDGDGDPDLIVGGWNELPRVYRNDIATGNHFLSLRLRGTSSNPRALGARVDVVPTEGGPAQHHLVGGLTSPDATNEPLVFAGTGRRKVVDRVTITWPSGVVQNERGLAADSLHVIDEWPLFTRSPKSRHLRAGSAGTLTLTVTPRDADGNARPEAVVAAVRRFGSGTVGEGVKEAGATVFSIAPAAAAGSMAVEITIDGVASPIRARLFWDAPETP
jgi:hypothetical protein